MPGGPPHLIHVATIWASQGYAVSRTVRTAADKLPLFLGCPLSTSLRNVPFLWSPWGALLQLPHLTRVSLFTEGPSHCIPRPQCQDKIVLWLSKILKSLFIIFPIMRTHPHNSQFKRQEETITIYTALHVVFLHAFFCPCSSCVWESQLRNLYPSVHHQHHLKLLNNIPSSELTHFLYD